MSDEKITRLKGRLKLLYEAEANALEMQSTSNAEGEQSSYASLGVIQKAIKDLEKELDDLIDNSSPMFTMLWKMRE